MVTIQQSRVPPPTPLQISSITSGPTATQSSLPPGSTPEPATNEAGPTPKKPHNAPLPNLHLEIRDLSSRGSKQFLDVVNAGNMCESSVRNICSLLYFQRNDMPPTHTVTLILESMDGIAYTTAKPGDNNHKEIHLSTNYIESISDERKGEEIQGVIQHEMVHCFQWDAFQSAPGGLIEGIADWVRLNVGLVPPHWSQDASGSWDGGYQHTAYFLQYLEQRFGAGTVVAINAALRSEKYKEESFWPKCCGHGIEKLWKDYGESLKKE